MRVRACSTERYQILTLLHRFVEWVDTQLQQKLYCCLKLRRAAEISVRLRYKLWIFVTSKQ